MTENPRIHLTSRQRTDLALSHALFECRAYLLVRCMGSPQAARLALICEQAADRLCPSDPDDKHATP